MALNSWMSYGDRVQLDTSWWNWSPYRWCYCGHSCCWWLVVVLLQPTGPGIRLWTNWGTIELMINQYSFIIIGLLILAIITFLVWRLIGIKYTIPVAGLTFVLLVAFQLVLSTNTNTYSSVDAFDNAIPSGNAVFLVLYSDFWIVCLSTKPAVDRLESNLEDDFLVVRLNVHSDLGKYVFVKYRGRAVPTYIVLDKRGNEVWRQTGSVPSLATILSLDL